MIIEYSAVFLMLYVKRAVNNTIQVIESYRIGKERIYYVMND